MGYYEKREGFKKPDKKAPRFRRSRLSLLNQELFQKFKEKNPTIEIDYKAFKRLILAFNSKIRYLVTHERDGVELPEQLGFMFIGTCPKTRQDNPDKVISAELDMKISHKNWESNQYLCRIFYSNYGTKYRFANREFWYFRPSRTFKKEASTTFLEQWNVYRKISPIQRVSQLYKEGIKGVKIQKHDYNNRRVNFTDTQPE